MRHERAGVRGAPRAVADAAQVGRATGAVLYPLHTAFGHQAWEGGVRLHAAGWGSMVTSLSQAGRALLPDYSEPIPVALKRGRGQLRGIGWQSDLRTPSPDPKVLDEARFCVHSVVPTAGQTRFEGKRLLWIFSKFTKFSS